MQVAVSDVCQEKLGQMVPYMSNGVSNLQVSFWDLEVELQVRVSTGVNGEQERIAPTSRLVLVLSPSYVTVGSEVVGP